MEFEYTQGHWFDQLKAIIFYTCRLLEFLSSYSFRALFKKKYALELPFLEIYK